MALQTLNTIKKWFKTGLKPTQAQFWDTWDSFRHKYDKVPVKDIDGIDELLLSKADIIVLDNHLSDKSAHAPQVNTDWNSASGFSQLLNKPEFRTINGETIVGTGDIAIKEGGSQDLDQTLLNGNTSETPIIVTKDYGGGAIATNTISSNNTIMTARNNPNDSVMLLLSPSGLNFSGSLTGQRTSLGISSLGVKSDDYDTDPGSAYFEFDKIQRHFRNENKNINLMFPKKNGTFTIATLDDVIDENNITLQKVLENGSTGIVPDGVKIGHNANDDSTWSTINLKEGDGIDIYSNNVLNVEAKNFYINTTNEGGFISGGDPDLESNPFRINSQNTGMSIGGGTKGIEIEGQGGSVKLSGTDNGNGGVQISSRLGIGKVKNIETDNIEINTGTAKLLYNDTEVATIDRLDGKINKIEKGIANGLATLDNDGKIPNSQIPALAISETFVINSQADMLALSQSEQGDVAVRTDLSKCFILRASPSSTLENWQELLTPSDSVQSVNGQVGNVNLTTAEIQESTNKNYQTDNQKLFNDATSSIQNQLNGKQANLGFTPEPAFSKNTSFNKNFGTVTGTVAEGNDSRINNGQTAFGWGNHASAGYALNNGTNASGTWGINITGNAQSATNWGGVPADFTTSGSNLNYLAGFNTSGVGKPYDANSVKDFLGLSSAITGTGTANTFPIFTAGGVLGNSSLSVSGNNAVFQNTGNTDFKIQTNTNGNPSLSLTAGGSDEAVIYYSRASSQLRFSNSGATDALVLNSSGYVGIGTSNPITVLSPNKTNQTPGSTTPSGAFLLTDVNATSYSLEMGSNAGSGPWIQARSYINATMYNLALNPNGGKVGIGTTAPSTNLSVFKPSGIGTVIDWGNVGGGAYGSIGFDGNGSYLTNFARVSALYINGTTSNVGIGTTTPLSGGSASKWLTIDGTTTYGGGLISSINGVGKGFYYYDNGFASVQGSAGSGVSLTVNGGSNGLTIQSNGNSTFGGTVTAPTFNGSLNGSATQWGSRNYNDGETNVLPAYVMAMKTNGVYSPHTSVAIQAFLGLNDGSTLLNSISGTASLANSLIDYVGGNLVKWGWNGSKATFRINDVDFGNSLPMNLSGNADSATKWGGYKADFSSYATTPNSWVVGYDSTLDGLKPWDVSQLRSFIGLGSSAYLNADFSSSANTVALRSSSGDLSTNELVLTTPTIHPSNLTAITGLYAGSNQVTKFNAGAVQSFLGLGTNAYNSTTYLPIQDGSRGNLNANTLVNSGFYNLADSPINTPVGLQYGQVISARGIDTGFQISGGFTSDSIWFRGWQEGGSNFTPWRKVWHDGNFNPANYLPLTGGALSGSLTATAFVRTIGSAPYYEFVNTSGSQLGYIQHNGSNLVLNTGVGGITLNNNTTVNGWITASGGFFNSDKRLKDIIKRDGNVAYFKWKDGRDDKTHIGYIAQEVQKTNPDQVIECEDGILSVNYIEILVQEIQSLKKEIQEMKGGNYGVC